MYSAQLSRSADEHGVVREELVLRNLQVEWGGALASAPRCIVVAAMAGAEPPVVITRIWQGHTACRAANASDTVVCVQGLGPSMYQIEYEALLQQESPW